MKNYDVLFFILLTLFSSLGLRLPQDNDTITALQTQVEKQSLELFQLRQDLYKKSSIDWMTQKDVKAFCKREGYLPMTHILLKKNIKDETIDLNLLHTLVNMPFHKMLIATSLKRTCRKGSKHYHGKAIDLRWDRNSKNLVEWLCTKEGRN